MIVYADVCMSLLVTSHGVSSESSLLTAGQLSGGAGCHSGGKVNKVEVLHLRSHDGKT
jgi:hypothetical protein